MSLSKIRNTLQVNWSWEANGLLNPRTNYVDCSNGNSCAQLIYYCYIIYYLNETLHRIASQLFKKKNVLAYFTLRNITTNSTEQQLSVVNSVKRNFPFYSGSTCWRESAGKNFHKRAFTTSRRTKHQGNFSRAKHSQKHKKE